MSRFAMPSTLPSSTERILQNFHHLFEHSPEQAEQELYKKRKLQREHQRIERMCLKRMRKNQSPVWNPAENKFIFDGEPIRSPAETMKRNILQVKQRRAKEAEIKTRLKQQNGACEPSVGPSFDAGSQKKKARTSTPPLVVPKIGNHSSTKNAVINYNGQSYELMGVSQEKDGYPMHLSWNEPEPNLVYFYHHDDRRRSAVLLPPAQKKAKTEAPPREKKPAIRLSEEEDLSGPSVNTVELIRMVHNRTK
ncbi:hypothetical protein QR680_005838 [Steinernema hermaphroditum]|uniref:Uncharacterized protein n=1 Tax=Steinernema hermaphroditum TaxID=289476 RepID=A0AA39HUW0_9BILA|nr:hypothetical protein QR680_005838 [Steinernema hermaphroditum]